MQDEGLQPELDEHGEPILDDDAADPAVLYRAGVFRGQSTLTPRLVACDAPDAFGTLGRRGLLYRDDVEPEAAVDPLSWGGSITTAAHEPIVPNAFLQHMHGGSGVVQGWASGYQQHHGGRYEGEGEGEGEGEEEYGEEYDDDEAGLAQATSGVRAMEVGGDGGGGEGGDDGEGGVGDGDGDSEVKASSFDLERSANTWSDYLQAHLHPRSLAPLSSHERNWSEMRRWGDGVGVVARQLARDEASSLLERVRRFLEEADAPQGFHLGFDGDGGYGGLAHELLTQVRDEYCSAPCLALSLNMLGDGGGLDDGGGPDAEGGGAEGGAGAGAGAGSSGASGGGGGGGGSERAAHSQALCDALALTSFAELRCCVVPLWSARASLAAATRAVPSLLAPRRVDPGLRYHAAALPATLLECATLAARARRPRASLGSIHHALAIAPSAPLAAGALSMPLPPAAPADAAAVAAGADATRAELDRRLAPAAAAATSASSSGAASELVDDWFVGCTPLQPPPRVVKAFGQHVTFVGQPGVGPAAARVVPALLPCRMGGAAGGGTLFARLAPLHLPLAYPQFFAPSLGVRGEVGGCRADGAELLSVPAGAALQATPGLQPLVRRVGDGWRRHRRMAERAAQSEGLEAENLAELSEQLEVLDEAYADPDAPHEEGEDEDDEDDEPPTEEL